jgi:hypothetical protein
VKGIQACAKEGDNLSPRKIIVKELIFKNLLLQNQQAKFNQSYYKLSLGEENSSLLK